MQYAPGVVVGRAFDAGYLYVRPTLYYSLPQRIISHHMIMAGSIVQVMSMFMLSLTSRGQYYEVFVGSLLYDTDVYHCLLGFPGASSWDGAWAVITLSAVYQCYWPSFQATKSACDGHCDLSENSICFQYCFY